MYDCQDYYSFFLFYTVWPTFRIVSMPTPDLGENHISALPELGGDVCSDSNSISNPSVGNKRAATEEKTVVVADSTGDANDGKRRRNAYEVTAYPPMNVTVARPMGGMKGHTAFLTFAICPDS
jgi:hypothetical protein